jgi:signal peptidase I
MKKSEISRRKRQHLGRQADVGNKQPKGTRESPIQFSISMICTLVVALFVLTFNVQAFEIPTGSMQRTLLVGDHVLVNRVDVGPQTGWIHLLPHHTIQRGDVIVFLSPAQPDMHLVKRVIGIPGDRIRLVDGVLTRNGNEVKESYAIRNGSYLSYRDNFPDVPPNEADGLTPEWEAELGSHIQNGELVVPAGKYFAMGDNRDNSYDSRYWGFVPQENIIGRPLIIYWSFDQSSDEYLKTSLPERVAYTSKVVIHFFDKTRWSRMFKFVR